MACPGCTSLRVTLFLEWANGSRSHAPVIASSVFAVLHEMLLSRSEAHVGMVLRSLYARSSFHPHARKLYSGSLFASWDHRLRSCDGAGACPRCWSNRMASGVRCVWMLRCAPLPQVPSYCTRTALSFAEEVSRWMSRREESLFVFDQLDCQCPYSQVPCRGCRSARHASRSQLRSTLRVLGVGVKNLWDVAGEVARHHTEIYAHFDLGLSFLYYWCQCWSRLKGKQLDTAELVFGDL